MKINLKNILAVVVAIVLVVVYLLLPGMEPIEDMNGPDDFSLAVLTDEDICANSYSSTSGLRTATGAFTFPGGIQIGDGMKFYAKELSGITEILWDNYLLASDIYLDVSHFSVESGNARLVVVNEGKIVAEIEPGNDILIHLEDVTGKISLRLATESAKFTLVIPALTYDSFEHS